jgi:hypothetical protein
MRHTSQPDRPGRRDPPRPLDRLVWLVPLLQDRLHGLSGNVSLSERKEPISCASVEVYRDGGFPRRRVIARGNDGEEGIPFGPLRQMRTGRPW